MEERAPALLALNPHEARTAAAQMWGLDDFIAADFDARSHGFVGGAVFPTCHGVNPTLTMWALCYRAAERLIERLQNGDER